MKRFTPLIFICLLMFSSASYAQKWWGAFAIDVNTGIAGGASDASNQSGAEDTALTFCKKKHKGQANKCKVVGAFYNSCGAIYWSPTKKKSVWAWDEVNAYRAGNRALSQCAKEGIKDCQLSLSFCNTRIFY